MAPADAAAAPAPEKISLTRAIPVRMLIPLYAILIDSTEILRVKPRRIQNPSGTNPLAVARAPAGNLLADGLNR